MREGAGFLLSVRAHIFHICTGLVGISWREVGQATGVGREIMVSSHVVLFLAILLPSTINPFPQKGMVLWKKVKF